MIRARAALASYVEGGEDKAELSESEKLQSSHAIAMLDHKIGVNHLETEENADGERALTKCIEFLEQNEPEDKELATRTLMDCYNQMGILWCNRSQSVMCNIMATEAKCRVGLWLQKMGRCAVGRVKLDSPSFALRKGRPV